MVYQMAQIPVTLSELEGHFLLLQLTKMCRAVPLHLHSCLCLFMMLLLL